MPARVVVGTSLADDAHRQRGDDNGACADHPGGRHRACRAAASAGESAPDTAQCWRFAVKPDLLFVSRSPSCVAAFVGLRIVHWAWPGVPDEIFSIDYLSITHGLAHSRACGAILFVAAPTSRCCRAGHLPRARCRSATARGAHCCCSERLSIPGGRRDRPLDVAASCCGPVGSRKATTRREKQKIAGIWMNADRDRFQLSAVLLCIAWRPLQSHGQRPHRLIFSSLHVLQLLPASASPKRSGGLKQGCSTCWRRAGLSKENHHIKINHDAAAATNPIPTPGCRGLSPRPSSSITMAPVATSRWMSDRS